MMIYMHIKVWEIIECRLWLPPEILVTPEVEIRIVVGGQSRQKASEISSQQII
jgi:hypothetical protein